MFAFRDCLDLGPGNPRVEVAFTDGTLDLQGRGSQFPEALAAVVEATGVDYARMNQVHGDVVHEVGREPLPGPDAEVPTADALLTTHRGVGLMVRVADCVPVLLADPQVGVIAAVHAGRAGVALDVVGATVTQMREHGAEGLTAWIGPHVCAGCYEVPAAMRDEIADSVPETAAQTRWGTPSLDLGAGVSAQLERAGVATVVRLQACTLEDRSLHSYRRDGAAAGRLAGLVWCA